MIELIRDWYRRHFSDPQAAILALLLLLGFGVVLFAGDILAPLLAAIVIAYVLDGAIERLQRLHIPRAVALAIVFTLFVAFLVFLVFGLVPMLLKQTGQLIREVPGIVERSQALLMQLPERYPRLVSEEQVMSFIAAVRRELLAAGQEVLSVSLSSVMGLITFMVYIILVPLMVFFFLKDKRKILDWVAGFLPRERGLSVTVWREVNDGVANYIRGKFVEIIIVWAVSFVTFTVLGLNFAMLLSFLVGISVIVPYVGAAVVTIPVAAVAYYQWGTEPEFLYAVIAYAVIQFLDGNLLVPILFSEVVNLHPVAIIAAVLVFGGIWGLWGVFFAIPLATLVKAVLTAWPRQHGAEKPTEAPQTS
ncbi:MAG TPA: AI-2E family transporter [Chromatiales bacterium]|nr:AI-2E family transporter [Chromatiales bacterium]